MTTNVKTPWQLFLRGLCILPLLLLPYFSLYYGITFPFSGWFMLPTWAIHLAALFVHESGHLVGFWLFGHPAAFPYLQLAFGGGATKYVPQDPGMLIGIYILWAFLAAWLYKRKQTTLLCFFPALLILHVSFALTVMHLFLNLYLGHFSEFGAATFCVYASLFRGTRDATPLAARGDAAIRSCGVAAGLYLIVKNMLQMAEIIFTKPLRFHYMPGSNSYGLDDIEMASAGTTLSLPVCASVVLIAGAGCLAFLVYVAWTRSRDFKVQAPAPRPR